MYVTTIALKSFLLLLFIFYIYKWEASEQSSQMLFASSYISGTNRRIRTSPKKAKQLKYLLFNKNYIIIYISCSPNNAYE